MFVVMRAVKTFAQTSNLNEHMNTFLGIEKFKCNYNECNKSCVTSQELKSHLQLYWIS